MLAALVNVGPVSIFVILTLYISLILSAFQSVNFVTCFCSCQKSQMLRSSEHLNSNVFNCRFKTEVYMYMLMVVRGYSSKLVRSGALISAAGNVFFVSNIGLCIFNKLFGRKLLSSRPSQPVSTSHPKVFKKCSIIIKYYYYYLLCKSYQGTQKIMQKAQKTGKQKNIQKNKCV